jgi:hypothetical protein
LTYNTEEHNIEHFKTYYNFISEYDEIIYKKNKYKIDRLCNIYKDNDIIGKYGIELNKVKLN